MAVMDSRRIVIFAVDTVAMLSEGAEFYISANGVWLVDAAPARFLTITNITGDK